MLGDLEVRLPESRLDVVRTGPHSDTGSALQQCLLAAADGSDFVLTLDARGSHDSAVITEMLEELQEGVDVVVGSRFADARRNQGVPRHRELVNRGMSAFVRFVAPASTIRDYSSGVAGYRAETIRRAIEVYGRDELIEEEGSMGVAELLLKLSAVSGSQREIPLRRRDPTARQGGRSSSTVSVGEHGALLRLAYRWSSAPLQRDDVSHVLAGHDPGLRENEICRALNVALAALGIVLAAPVMAIVALLVKLTSPGPVLYKQTRIGLDRRRSSPSDPNPRRRVDYTGKPFTLYKFRTMYAREDDEEEQVWASPDDPRVTPLGRILRKFRLDELPQLFNVLRGDMNLVGPRPEQPEIALRLSDEVDGYRYRHRVRPGITGWAQVNSSYDQTINDVRNKVRYDLEYVYRRSPLQDLKITVRTIPVVLLQRGAW